MMMEGRTQYNKMLNMSSDNNDDDSNSKSPSRRVECWGQAKGALKEFRQRMHELEKLGRSKPDMIAFKELRHRLTPERTHGELPGVPIGLVLKGRGEAAILGIHQSMLRGIDAVKGRPCYAVCVSGGYADDDDHSKPDGTIYYTGEGGQNKKGEQEKDQSYESVGNAALIQSKETGLTIRVLRGQYPQYFYLGLYRCIDYTYGPGVHGKKVFKFTLVPCIENQCPRQRSVALESKFKWYPPPLQLPQPQPQHPFSSPSFTQQPVPSKVASAIYTATDATMAKLPITTTKKKSWSSLVVHNQKPKPHSKKGTVKARLNAILKKKTR